MNRYRMIDMLASPLLIFQIDDTEAESTTDSWRFIPMPSVQLDDKYPAITNPEYQKFMMVIDSTLQLGYPRQTLATRLNNTE